MSLLPTNSIESLLYHAHAEELDPLFDKLKLQNSAKRRCKQIFQDVFSHGIISSKIPNSEIFASILYLAVIESSSSNNETDSNDKRGSFPTLTDILTATNVNINKMFTALQAVREKVEVSESFEQRFCDLTQRYLVISLLFHTFERKCGDVFKKDTCENDENESVASPIRKTEGVECRKKLTWVLFLLTKYHLLPYSSELYLHFQLLLCCLEYVLSKTPMFLLNSPYAAIRFRHDSTCAGESMLEKLSKDFDVNFEETQALHCSSTEPFFNTLSDSDGDVDLLFQCDKLCEMYSKISSEAGALNELLFLSNDARIMPLQIASLPTADYNPNPTKPGQMTPIRGTLSAVHQLEKILNGLKEEPSEKLLIFFKRCSQNPAAKISDKVVSMKGDFLLAYQTRLEPGSSQHALGQQRLTQGTKLFYRVLECMMVKNSQRMTENVINALLNKDMFIKSAFAFSMEIVLATYGQRWDPKSRTLRFGDSSFPFPCILKALSLDAYKFDIMLEHFMSALESLPPDIIKYLQSVCNQIYVKLAWEEGSLLFDVLAKSDLSQMPPPFASPIKGANDNNNTAMRSVELLLSPGPGTSSSAAEGSLMSPQDKDKKRLMGFLSKVNKLGFSLISSLCNNLDLSEEVKDKIWTCVDYCIKKENIDVLKNRHIEQVVICCIRGMCKTLNLDITLEAVIDQYKMLPTAKSEVYEHVFICDGETSSIANFNRNVFEESKTYEKICQFSHSNSQIPPLSPRPKLVRSSPRPSPHVTKKTNLTISPMCGNSLRSPGKYKSSIGTAINPESPNTFKMINEQMSAKSLSLQQQRTRTVKRLDFDDTSNQPDDLKHRKLDDLPRA